MKRSRRENPADPPPTPPGGRLGRLQGQSHAAGGAGGGFQGPIGERSRGINLPARARQNVVLELGYFWGVLGRKHVCALVKGDVERPSDVHGLVYVKLEGNWMQELFRELREAGMDFDQTKA